MSHINRGLEYSSAKASLIVDDDDECSLWNSKFHVDADLEI